MSMEFKLLIWYDLSHLYPGYTKPLFYLESLIYVLIKFSI